MNQVSFFRSAVRAPSIIEGLDACEARDVLAIEYAKGRDDGFSRESAAAFLDAIREHARRTGRSVTEVLVRAREDAEGIEFVEIAS